MRLLFLHLSDLHFCSKRDVCKENVREISQALSPTSIGSVDGILILVTGDIAFSGKKESYTAFLDFKDLLESELKAKQLQCKSISLHFVPGNHDIDYAQIKAQHDRQYYEQGFFSKDVLSEIDISIGEEVAMRNEFYLFSKSEHALGEGENSLLFRRDIVDVDGFSIEVNLLDTTYFSLLTDNDQGLHYLPLEVIERLESGSGAEMAITLMHHSHQWFNDSCKRELEKVLLTKNTMIFCGHEHFSATQKVTYNGITPAHVFCGGSLCNQGNWESGEFFACVYDTTERRFQQFNFLFENNVYVKKLELSETLWPKYSGRVPGPRDEKNVNSLIEDSLAHLPGQLSDYYVFPGLRKEAANKNDKVVELTEEKDFFKRLDAERRVEIIGADASGKSTLLKRIFQYYLFRKYVILCRCEDISSGNRHRIIKSLFEQIYGGGAADYSRFEHAPKEDKMILIDDIHLIKEKNMEKFLEGIEDDFGYVIYTTNNQIKLDIRERIWSAVAKDSYSNYQILPLFREKRRNLVEKAVALKYPEEAKSERENLTERICQTLDTQRKYIPLTPSIVLQFVEWYATYHIEAWPNDADIFGKVFEASITTALSQYMTKSLKVDKAMLVLGKIAFSIHKTRKYPISQGDIVLIIGAYCEEYSTTINAKDFIKILEDAKIMVRCADDVTYRFCNNNYLAYFVASEITANKDREAVRYCMEYACFGINSTILMFVTYLTHETELIEQIVKVADAVASGWKKFEFGMPELDYLEIQAPPRRILPPSKTEIDQDRKVDEQKDRQETESSRIDVVSVYDYDEHEVEKLENQLICAISLLRLIARCLPNFEHRLKKEKKEAVIKTLYELPNKIFYAWAIEVKSCEEDILQLILSMETNEFTRRIKTKDDAKRLLQWDSIMLLLELYYGAVSEACRDNTFEFMTQMSEQIVECNRETYQLERLIVLGQSKKIDKFCAEGKVFKKNVKSPAAELAFSEIVYQLLVKGNLPMRQINKLETQFLNGTSHSANIVLREIENKKEK